MRLPQFIHLVTNTGGSRFPVWFCHDYCVRLVIQLLWGSNLSSIICHLDFSLRLRLLCLVLHLPLHGLLLIYDMALSRSFPNLLCRSSSLSHTLDEDFSVGLICLHYFFLISLVTLMPFITAAISPVSRNPQLQLQLITRS